MDGYFSRSSSPRKHSLEDGSIDNDADIYEKDELLGRKSPVRNPARWVSNYWFNIIFLLNIGISLFLIFAGVVLARQRRSHINAPEPPYSLLREDGAVRYINTQYKPQKIYQSPTSPEVEEAWDGWLKEYDVLAMIPTKQAAQASFPESIEPYLDPGYSAYGLAVYHQMHCLNRIRKSFYPDKFFPDEAPEKLEHHKNHCFDMLRQSILCHGDIAMVYWWNRNYTYVDEGGVKRYSDWYLQSDPMQRSKGSYTAWDTQVQCRDMDAVHAWAKAHSVDADKYKAQSHD